MWFLMDLSDLLLPALGKWLKERNTKTAEQAQLDQQNEVLNDVQEGKEIRRRVAAANDSDVDQQLQHHDWLRKDDE